MEGYWLLKLQALGWIAPGLVLSGKMAMRSEQILTLHFSCGLYSSWLCDINNSDWYDAGKAFIVAATLVAMTTNLVVQWAEHDIDLVVPGG